MTTGISQTAVEISRIEFAWPGGKPVLAIDSLVLTRGERVFLQGASGSGKSSLLGLIGGILVPQAGTIRVMGVVLEDLGAAARDRFRAEHIGFVFQMFNLIPYLSLRANVLLPLRFSALRRSRLVAPDPEAEALRLLAALGLSGSELLGRPVSQLSIGQQQRVAAARALIGRPDLIVADEPTSALDADSRQDFLRLLMDQCDAAGSTLLFVSHDASLGALFDRRLAMRELNRVLRSPPEHAVVVNP